MKKNNILLTVVVLALLAVMLSACGKSEFGVSENTGKLMTVTAKNASKDTFFMVGSLEVVDGEQIVITSNLTKGKVRVEIIREDDEQSIDELPNMNGDPVISADISGTDGKTESVPAGNYMLKATCLEKATGTVQIEVKPAE